MDDKADNQEVLDRLAEAEAVEAAVRAAVRDALRKHKRAGNPVVVWRDGKVEWVPAERIVIDDETDLSKSPR